MKQGVAAADPEAYLASLSGWQRDRVHALRASVRATAGLQESVKWGHLVYHGNGPVCLIRAEDHRVLFGFWRGQRLREIEPRLKPGGKYEMATLELQADTAVRPSVARALVREATRLNVTLGDPTKAASAKRAARKGSADASRGRRRAT